MRDRALKTAALALWDLAARPLGYFDARRLRLGHWGMPRAYTAQLAEMYDRNRLGPVGGGAEYETALTQVTQAIYSLSSDGDRWFASPRNVGAFLALMPSARITRHVIRHTAARRAPDHMGLVLSGDCRPEWEAIGAWILKQAAERDRKEK